MIRSDSRSAPNILNHSNNALLSLGTKLMPSHCMNIVVGSGPAGIACAKALTDNGEEVTMLDVGLDLSQDRKEDVAKLRAASGQGENSSGEGEQIVEGMKSEMMATGENGEMPKKLRYGSDYPYRKTDETLQIQRSQFGGSASFAKGGFSAVWGAGVLPFRDADIDDWPIGIEALEPYYERTFDMMNLTTERDGLEEIFPLYHDNPQQLQRSEQAQIILNSMRSNSKTLNDNDIHFGSSRLAMQAEGEDGCPHCGLKIFGCCPKGSVYDTSQTLAELRNSETFQYVDGVLVEEVAEDSDGAIARGEQFDTGESVSYEGEKIFLACGAIPTTKILLRSLDLYKTAVEMKETPYFILPLVTVRGASDVTEEDLNTLSQIFIEIFDDSVSDYTVHLQLYTYNELYRQNIKDMLGPLRHLAKPFFGSILNRSVVAMGYMHSTHADGITVELQPDGELSLSGEISDQMRSDVLSVARKLQKNTFSLDFLTLSPAMMLKDPGQSFHVGGTFPMSDTPSRTETDQMGKPAGFDRIHAVDSTIFPTIPATTITASIMAMAYRIGDMHRRV